MGAEMEQPLGNTIYRKVKCCEWKLDYFYADFLLTIVLQKLTAQAF